MAKKYALAGILGGFALFLWGGLSHMVLGLGEHGVQSLSQPQAISAMKAAVPKDGLYYFPVNASGKLAPEQEGGPWGILVYHGSGASMAMSRQLLKECILNIVQALLAAFLLSLVPGISGFVSRVGFVVLAGLLGAASFSIEYWNWYGYPASYTGALIIDRVIGFAILGAVVAAFVKPAVVSTPSEIRAAKAA